jgi:phage terminase large subunit-like protein
MGLAGPGRKSIKPASLIRQRASSRRHPWEAKGLSRAARVIRFIESMPCSSGPLAGTRFKLRPWQKKFIRAVYKTDKKNGRRLVRTAVLSVGRGQGKTTLAALLALCHLAGPEAESRGEIYSAANDRFQASRIFNEISAIVQRVPWLDERVTLRRFTKEAEDIGGTGSLYAALSADAPTKHGLAPTLCVYDELGQTMSRDLLDAIETASGKRGGLLLVISTQAARDDAPMSQLVDYGLRVQRGEIDDPSFHLTLYSAPKDSDPWSPTTWKLANPALGDFRSLKDVERLALQAQKMVAAEASFKNLILNMRINATEHFISSAVWKACGSPVDVSSLKGRPCYGGLDLAASRDLSALVLAFEADDGTFDLLPFFWLPDDDLREREDTDGAPYVRWRESGFLLTAPGKTMDPEVIARKLAELHGQYQIRALAHDRWRVEDLRRELSAIGTELLLVPHGQGYKDMTFAVEVFERLTFEQKLRHGNNPILTWNVSNARVTADPANNRKPDKIKSTGRIDGLVAACLALSVATRHVQQPEWQPFLEIV